MAGFEESNGLDGWADEMDWLAKPEGDRALAAEYFKKAGFASGKYEGGETLLIVGDNAEPDKSIAQITEQQLNEMGFKTKLRLVTRDTMLTRFCNVPDSEVNVCPSVGWSLDFADPQTMLDPTFNGNNIIPSQNSNWPEVDDPQLNDADRGGEARDRARPSARRRGRTSTTRSWSGRLDPLHVGLPVGRDLAEHARRAERLQHDLGLELHVGPLIRSPGRQGLRTTLPRTSPAAIRPICAGTSLEPDDRVDLRPQVPVDAEAQEPLELLARAHRRAGDAEVEAEEAAELDLAGAPAGGARS